MRGAMRTQPGTAPAQTSIMRPAGGLVFQQVHKVLANVPPENVIAMFEAARVEE